jgi:hypothetical protein
MEPITRYNPTAISHGANSRDGAGGAGTSLMDVLDRVLDKGVVIAGDIRINLLDIELLTIKIRLLIASADKAKEMGIDWWSHDPHLSSQAKQDQQRLDASKENKALRERVEKLEAQLKALADHSGPADAGQRNRAASAPGRRN